MDKKQLKYIFNYVTNCNMCGADLTHQKVLGKRLNRSQRGSPKRKIGITTTICKCRKCGLIYSNPQPIPVDIQDHYGVSPAVYWKGQEIIRPDNDFGGEIKIAKELINFKPGAKALDIGAGLGMTMVSLSQAGFDTYGIEPSETFYKQALSIAKVDPGRIRLTTIQAADFPENNFEFMTFRAVLEHLEDPSLSIQTAMKWLKPGGIMHVEVPSSGWLTHKLVNLFYKLILSDYVANLSPMHTPFHLYEFGLHSFEQNAARNQFEIVKHEYYVCETYLPKIADFILKPLMKSTNTGMQLCVWLRKK